MKGKKAGGTGAFYEEVFARVAPQQMPPERTDVEVALIERALEPAAGARVLDLGCGYGRLAVPLAGRGYAVTGIDLSRNSLREARRAARGAGASVRWLRRDLRDIPFPDYFDGAICMGAFGTMETDEEDLRTLAAVHGALKPGGRFLLDHKNRDWQVRHYEPSGRVELPDGAVSEWRTEVDLAGGYRWDFETFIEAGGARREFVVRERLYTLDELRGMLRAVGLLFQRAWGDHRGGDYGPDSPRMIVLARRGP